MTALAVQEVRLAALDPDAGSVASERGNRFRPDIEGLRAVAVLLVVLYHAGVSGFGGGFVGVDVFFVISGFLITGLLLEDLRTFGRVHLGTFWARRARRLLPAMSAMVIAVLAGSVLLVSPLEWKQTVTAAVATATYWANHLFAHQAVDYFQAGAHPSPLLHTWSLAVEEQFYLVWPLLLGGAGFLAARTRADVRWVCGATVALVTCWSLLVAIPGADRHSTSAFFSAGARAWELGAGGLLAIAAPRLTSTAMRWLVGGIGTALLLLTVWRLDAHSVFPGRGAIAPVLGTVAILAAGLGRSWPGGRVLSTTPLRYIGRLSYAWYLWHWPVLTLGIEWIGRDTLPVRLALVAVSFVPAVGTHYLVENRFRQSPNGTRSAGRTLKLSVALMGAVALCAGAIWTNADRTLRDPLIATLVRARGSRPPLPDVCATTDVLVLRAQCSVGSTSAQDPLVLVVGDSHAAQWVPGLAAAAKQDQLQLVTSIQGWCPVVGHGFAHELPSCGRRIAQLPELVKSMRPDLVVMADSAGYVGQLLSRGGRILPRDEQMRSWSRAIETWARELHADGVPLLDILEIPTYAKDPVDCVARIRRVASCELTRSAAEQSVASIHAAEDAGIARAGFGKTLDPLALVCVQSRCPLLRNDGLVYTDGSHLTSTFSASQASVFRQVLRESLGSGGPTSLRP